MMKQKTQTYSTLHLERVAIPNHAEVNAKKEGEWWSLAIAEGIYQLIWGDTLEAPNHYTAQVGDNAKGYKYVVAMSAGSGKLAKLAKEVQKKQKSKDRPAIAFTHYLINTLNPISQKHGYDFYILHISNEWMFMWPKDQKYFSIFSADLSAIIRELTKAEANKQVASFANSLLKDSNVKKLQSVAKKMLKEVDLVRTYEKTFEILNQLEISIQTSIPFLATLGFIYGSNKKLKVFACQKGIPEALASDSKSREELFYTIQRTFQEHYCNGFSGYPTKELFEDTVRLLAGTLAAYGYGVYPNSIVSIIRLFPNDVEQGMTFIEYHKNEVFDSNTYAYSDSNENNELYDEIWKTIDVNTLLEEYR